MFKIFENEPEIKSSFKNFHVWFPRVVKILDSEEDLTVENDYISVDNPDWPSEESKKRYIQEHRLVAEYFLKRRLKLPEEIHHVNYVKCCNHPKNIMVFKSSSSHHRFEAGRPLQPDEIIFDGRKMGINPNW